MMYYDVKNQYYGISNLSFCKSLVGKVSYLIEIIISETDNNKYLHTVNNLDLKHIKSFYEKPKGDGLWINGGFMVCEPEVFNYIENDNTIWEQHSMPQLAIEGKLSSFKHSGFWRPMDTLQDKYKLNELWESNKAPWKIWE